MTMNLIMTERKKTDLGRRFYKRELLHRFFRMDIFVKTDEAVFLQLLKKHRQPVIQRVDFFAEILLQHGSNVPDCLFPVTCLPGCAPDVVEFDPEIGIFQTGNENFYQQGMAEFRF